MANNSSLSYGIYDFEEHGYMKPPKPRLNGGLYTGEEFKEDAEYGNVPVVSDVDYMMSENLKSARGPDEARFHYPGNVRPGNNIQLMPGLVEYSNHHHIKCVSNKEVHKSKEEVLNVEPYNPNEQFQKY
tara:strand:+ start:33 stop:419 length:387 start_codon:yes stop_codon:yes gene_type:complete